MNDSERTHLYTLRLWKEELGNGASEWRGQLQQVTSQECYYFRDWESLLSLLARLLPYKLDALTFDALEGKEIDRPEK